jgi:hypothetical protein
MPNDSGKFSLEVGGMLTPEQKAAIRAEEVFREEIRNEIASARRPQQRGRKLWDVLNSSLIIWFLTSIVVGVISWKISDAALNRERRETLRRLKWEVYNDGVQFEDAVKRALNRFEYEAAFSERLQNPKARLVDLKPFGMDRMTFEMEHLGATADRNAAAAARQATLDVWHLIESKLGKLDWHAALDDKTKKELDESINTIVQKEIIAPFSL